MYSRGLPATSIVNRPLAAAALALQPALGSGAPGSTGAGVCGSGGVSLPGAMAPVPGASESIGGCSSSAPTGDPSVEPGVGIGASEGWAPGVGAVGCAVISGAGGSPGATGLSELSL